MHNRTEQHTNDSTNWDETIAAWRGPVRTVTAIGVLVALAAILIWTQSHADYPRAEAYLGGIFFAVLAIGVGIAVSILTSL